MEQSSRLKQVNCNSLGHFIVNIPDAAACRAVCRLDVVGERVWPFQFGSTLAESRRQLGQAKFIKQGDESRLALEQDKGVELGNSYTNELGKRLANTSKQKGLLVDGQ